MLLFHSNCVFFRYWFIGCPEFQIFFPPANKRTGSAHGPNICCLFLIDFIGSQFKSIYKLTNTQRTKNKTKYCFLPPWIFFLLCSSFSLNMAVLGALWCQSNNNKTSFCFVLLLYFSSFAIGLWNKLVCSKLIHHYLIYE